MVAMNASTGRRGIMLINQLHVARFFDPGRRFCAWGAHRKNPIGVFAMRHLRLRLSEHFAQVGYAGRQRHGAQSPNRTLGLIDHARSR